MIESRNNTLARALTAHDAGDLHNARLIYRSLLTADPCDAQVNFFLGLAMMQAREFAEAINSFGRALSIMPADAGAWNYLCLCQLELKNPAMAADAARASVICDEVSEDAHYNLGVALRAKNDHSGAIASLRKSAVLNPHAWKAFNNLGLSSKALGDSIGGYSSLHKAVQSAPNEVGPLFNMGALLQDQGMLAAASQMYAAAVDLLTFDSIDSTHRGDLYRNLGIVLTTMGQSAEGRAWLAKSVCISPGAVLSLNNYGNSLKETLAATDAMTAYDRALTIDPCHAEAIWNKALLFLLMGDVTKGFSLYESRWDVAELFPSKRVFSMPRYQGHESVSGRHIFVYAEQGLGDTIQFSRFSRRLVERGARVTLEVHPPLVPLMRQSNIASHVVARGEPEPLADCQIPLMSLPAVWKLTESELGMQAPYLYAHPDRIKKWGEMISREKGVLNIGVCWRGSDRYRADASRSFGPDRFARLASRQDVMLYSLHQSDQAEQGLLGSLGIASFDEDFDRNGVFLDSIAIFEHLDLVITSDTSIAHLAAAAGKPAWIVLALVPDWRWMLSRDNSPWYPTVRLFRQAVPGDWDGIFLQIERELDQLTGESG